jgi:hypothetical protein
VRHAEARRAQRSSGLRTVSLFAILAFVPNAAHAYIGPSFLQLPGLVGDARHADFGGWIRAEANYWSVKPDLPDLRGARSPKNDLLFTTSDAPASGSNVLALAIDKTSAAYKTLMGKCRSGERIAEATFAESSHLARHPQEHGPIPADVPAYYRYRLKGITLSCPEAAGAPEQAFRVHFEDIEWLNFRPQANPRPITAEPAPLPSGPSQGRAKTFALTWFAAAVDSHAAQCPKMNAKPAESDYFALLPTSRAADLRAQFAGQGVPPAYMQYRGPDEMHVGLMPGIVPDPGHLAPVTEVAPGFDLDGHDGTSPAPANVRPHKNFVSPEGQRGIDNQLMTVEGCVEGFRRKGFLPMIFNESRAKGRPTALVEISGIDDERNDDEVAITFFYSTDVLKQSPDKVVLADYTFRVTDNPEFAQDFVRFRGKIRDGVVTTDVGEKLHVHEMFGIETTFFQPRLRFEMRPDGTIKGHIGGYLDWRQRLVWQIYRSSDYENTIGFKIPGIYNAMKRAADGLPDPVTGEFHGISAAFEIEGVSAFIPPAQRNVLLAQAGPHAGGSATKGDNRK